MKSDEEINSSVEDLVPIPSESEGISDDTCDVPSCDNSPSLDVLSDHFDIFSDFNNDGTSSDDVSFEDIDYVEASPPDSKLFSLEEVKDDILREKLLNINLLIASDLPSSDDFSPINSFEEKSMTFSNPLFDSNDDFISSDDESLSDEDFPEDNVKIYSNPLFDFDDEYISSDVNPLFDEVLENIESKDFYDSNLDESDLLVTPLFDANKDECFDSRGDVDEINDFEDGYYDSEGDILYLENFLNDDLVYRDPSIPAMSVASILDGFTDEPPLEKNDDLFDLESKNDDWKKIYRGSPGRNKTPRPWSAHILMWKLFKGLGVRIFIKKDKNEAKTDKTGHENGKSVKYRSRSYYLGRFGGKVRIKVLPTFLYNEEIEADEDDKPDDVVEIIKIEGNLFDFETPLCKAFNEFNYLLKIDIDLFICDIQEIRTYEEHKYELNNNMTEDLEEPWSDNGGHIV
uniref:Uncharacterized protein n=1 Tax=Tanacetum cinerariifolium TaxID=118510 RepID=A0A6L2K5Z6_TANCI|nr:hypothetical protein [Tanacetum cinerariifolium]